MGLSSQKWWAAALSLPSVHPIANSGAYGALYNTFWMNTKHSGRNVVNMSKLWITQFSGDTHWVTLSFAKTKV